LETYIEEPEDSKHGSVCLGVESTAHTFGASVVSTRSGAPEILSDVRDIYRPEKGAGIHPREASKHHSQVAASVLSKALKDAGVKIDDVDAVAFSQGPGLGPCLRVGAVVARSVSAYYGKPLIPVNHAVAHIELAAMLTGASDPLVLLVSGGHTVITAFAVRRWRVFGETLDLTVGQMIDQFGRAAGYASPFGREFEAFSNKSTQFLDLPYTVKGNDVSFSGLLTASKRLLTEGQKLEDVCFSMRETGFAMLAEVVERALAFTEKKEVLVAGGVAANLRLREMLSRICEVHDSKFLSVPREYSGDCGAQIAWNGLQGFEAGVRIDVEKSIVKQSWRLDEVDVSWRN
jgi:N6-L-threonylcarbamoyladenine synthase